MAREIKFRVWDKQDKRMITDEQDFIPLKVTNKGVLRLDPTQEENRWSIIDGDRFELMQFTGLKDKHGQEIFEGDILIDGAENDLTQGSVFWKDGRFQITLIGRRGTVKDIGHNFGTYDLHNRKGYGLTIIGNLFEHPHLLAGGDRG